MFVDKSLSRGLIILGVLLAIGMSAAAFIFGMQAKHIGSGKQTITVKGLAEQPVTSTRAEWRISVKSHAETFEEALNALRKERSATDIFLQSYPFGNANIIYATENVESNMVYIENENGRGVSVQRGFNGRQIITVKTDKLDKVQEARAKIIEFRAKGHTVESSGLDFVVGNLDDVKLKLIGLATKNAKARAIEFAKNGDVTVGVMRTASQGTFDILPADRQADDNSDGDNYSGGSFDTTSINKIARVVVTIEYNIER